MFAYYYPPCVCAPSANERTAGLAAGLDRFGWRSTVVTRDLDATPCRCSGTRGVGGEDGRSANEVVRVKVRPTKAMRLRNVLDRRSVGSENPVMRLMRRTVTALLLLRENEDDWIDRSIEAARRLPADAVWTTSRPFSSISIGRVAATRGRLPWVADLRDSIFGFQRGGTIQSALQSGAGRRLRRDLVHACRVVEVTAGEAKRDAGSMAVQPIVIPSGFDEAAWNAIRATEQVQPDRGRFVVAYTGTLYPGFDPQLFFDGLAEFIRRDRDLGRMVEVRYLGPDGRAMAKAAETAAVASSFVDLGWNSITEARVVMARANCVLLFTVEGSEGVPGGKFYEYLASGAPLLVVPGGDGYVDAILKELDAGAGVSTPQQVAEVLSRWVGEWGSGRERPRRTLQSVSAHSWDARAQMLARVLDECGSGST